MTWFGPDLDPPLAVSSQNALTHARRHEYFIPTEFRKHLTSFSVIKVHYVFLYIYMH